jgi:tetratricopeptide (TPR) repeat protein
VRIKTISLSSLLVLSFVMSTLGQPGLDGLLDIGNALYESGKYDEAIRAYDKVTQQNPNQSEA